MLLFLPYYANFKQIQYKILLILKFKKHEDKENYFSHFFA